MTPNLIAREEIALRNQYFYEISIGITPEWAGHSIEAMICVLPEMIREARMHNALEEVHRLTNLLDYCLKKASSDHKSTFPKLDYQA